MIQPGEDWRGPPMAVVRWGWECGWRGGEPLPLQRWTACFRICSLRPLTFPGAAANRTPITFSTGPLPSSPPLQLLNKTDLLEAEELESLAAWYKEHCRAQAVLPLSALEGRGLEAVQDWLEAQLPEGPSMYPKVRRGGGGRASWVGGLAG